MDAAWHRARKDKIAERVSFPLSSDERVELLCSTLNLVLVWRRQIDGLEVASGTASFLELPRVGNSYQPLWSGRPGWDDVWLTSGTRIEFQLYDVDDVDANDPIGTASIFAEDLWRAVEEGGTTEV